MENGDRIGRGEYCRGVIPCIIILVAIMLIWNHFFNKKKEPTDTARTAAMIVISTVFGYYWPLGNKRCHDLGLSGWCQMIPLFNPFYLMCKEGEKGTNKYGPNPNALEEEAHSTLENAQSATENNQKTESEEHIAIAMPNDINSKIEVLERFKGLLDSGAITQEEFDKVKADILKQISAT